ncbi:MAG: hypothetical protein WA767_00450, partial [Pseudolabrys sp.]
MTAFDAPAAISESLLAGHKVNVCPSKRYAVGDIIEPVLEEERFAEERERLARITEKQQMEGSAAAHSAAAPAPDATSSISSGLSIVGKIVG